MSSSEHPRKSVAVNGESTVRHDEFTSRKPRKSPNMAKQVFERFNGAELTDHMLEEAAQLFNESYGTWGKDPTNPGPAPKPAKLGSPTLSPVTDVRIWSPVKLSKNRLRAQYLPDNVACSYVRVTIEDRLAGNAFACRWSCAYTNVCWVTQLVVHSEFRCLDLQPAC